MHVRASRKRLTVTALEVQDRLVHARFDCHGDAAFPRRDARKTGPADPVACLLTEAQTVRGHRDAAAPPCVHLVSGNNGGILRSEPPAGPAWRKTNVPPAQRPATMSAAAPRCRALDPSIQRHGEERALPRTRAAECGVVPFPHRVVLPPVDVHRIRPSKPGTLYDIR